VYGIRKISVFSQAKQKAEARSQHHQQPPPTTANNNRQQQQPPNFN
jgi:hypothetical protein